MHGTSLVTNLMLGWEADSCSPPADKLHKYGTGQAYGDAIAHSDCAHKGPWFAERWLVPGTDNAVSKKLLLPKQWYTDTDMNADLLPGQDLQGWHLAAAPFLHQIHLQLADWQQLAAECICRQSSLLAESSGCHEAAPVRRRFGSAKAVTTSDSLFQKLLGPRAET